MTEWVKDIEVLFTQKDKITVSLNRWKTKALLKSKLLENIIILIFNRYVIKLYYIFSTHFSLLNLNFVSGSKYFHFVQYRNCFYINLCIGWKLLVYYVQDGMTKYSSIFGHIRCKKYVKVHENDDHMVIVENMPFFVCGITTGINIILF